MDSTPDMIIDYCMRDLRSLRYHTDNAYTIEQIENIVELIGDLKNEGIYTFN